MKLTQAQFFSLAYLVLKNLRDSAPKRTGNLAFNAIKIEFKGNEARIYIDQSIAPYMIFTNQPWISPKSNGRANPNEYWFNDAAAYTAYFVAGYTGGTLKRSS